MTLNKSTSEEAFKEYVAELMRSGKHTKEQALAIAYEIKRGEDCGMDDLSARDYDANNWPEIKKNPISKVGVFPYLGRQIDPSLEPDQVYQVYRPAEELSNPETIDSFKLIPWVHLHPKKLLGDKDLGRMPAEAKGIEGVTGQDVVFEGDTLYSNLKLFSNDLQEIVDSGEANQLSLGYSCKYKIQSGLFNGKAYDAIQHTIRGNHLASVPEGRMGPEVAVLDHLVFTCDAKDITMPEETKEEKEKKEAADRKAKDAAEEEMKEKEAKDKMAKDAAEEEEKKKEKEAADKAAQDAAEEEEKKKKDGMDASIASLRSEVETLKKGGIKAMLGEIAKRDALASQIAGFVGAFDAADKTLEEVAAYGIEKLGIKCPKGHEQTALDAYFIGRTPVSQEIGFALDANLSKTTKSLKDLVA